MEGFYEPRATNHYFFTSRGLLEAMLLIGIYRRAAAFESEAACGLRTAIGGPSGPYYWLLVMGAGARRRQQHQRIASQTGMMRTAVSMSGIWVIIRTMKQRKARQK